MSNRLAYIMTAERTGFVPVGRRSIVCVESEVGFTRYGKVVNGESVEQLCGLELVGDGALALDLCQTVTDEEDEHDEQAVRRSLDLKVAEERVGSEQIECLVNDVERFGLSWGVRG